MAVAIVSTIMLICSGPIRTFCELICRITLPLSPNKPIHKQNNIERLYRHPQTQHIATSSKWVILRMHQTLFNRYSCKQKSETTKYHQSLSLSYKHHLNHMKRGTIPMKQLKHTSIIVFITLLTLLMAACSQQPGNTTGYNTTSTSANSTPASSASTAPAGNGNSLKAATIQVK